LRRREGLYENHAKPNSKPQFPSQNGALRGVAEYFNRLPGPVPDRNPVSSILTGPGRFVLTLARRAMHGRFGNMATVPAVPPLAPSLGAIPPLENGDQLSRSEFERRYHAMPHLKKAELIEGTVHMPSPVRFKKHGKPHLKAAGWIHLYEAHTPGVEAADNATVRLDLDNEPQPDVILRILPERGGATSDSEDDYVEGAPELCVEVASSSAAYDCHSKKRAYRRNGVREYLIWLVGEGKIEWWRLAEDEYRLIEPDADGVIKSHVFPGLWLDADALLAHDSKRVIEVLRTGIESPEHAAFVARLAG